MSFADVINLVITVNDRSPTQPGFGTPLIMGYHTAWLSDFVREYAEADDMLLDGFTSSHYLYQCALTVKSQSPCPQTFKIGRRTTPLQQKMLIAPTNTQLGFVNSGVIGGKAWSYVNGGSETLTSVATGIAAAITAAVSTVSTIHPATTVTVTTTLQGVVLDYTIGVGMQLTDVTVDTTTTADIGVIAAEDANWYGLLIADSESKATIVLGAAWTEAQRKIYAYQTCDDACGDTASTTDVAATLQASAYARTGGIYHRNSGGTEWLAAGWMAGRLTSTPGSDTWAFKTIAGPSVDVSPFASTGMEAGFKKKNLSYYDNTGGLNLTFGGTVSDGEFFDTIRFVDWVYANIRVRVLSAFANNAKIPYTDAGVDCVRSAILSVLKQGIDNGGFADDQTPTVTAPKVLDVDPSVRATRNLPNVKFTARLAGAIHSLNPVTGTVSV